VSTCSIGLSTSLWACLVSRLVGGLCNGLWCVLKSAVADIVTDTKGQSRCFALMQIASSLGAIVGPTIGGVLVGLGGSNSERRFALPCFLCAILQLILCGSGVALWPARGQDADDSAKKHDASFAMAPSAQAFLEEAVDGDSIRCLPELLLLETPPPPSSPTPPPPPPPPRTLLGESKANTPTSSAGDESSLLVYEVTGSSTDSKLTRRFKVFKASPGPQVRFVLAGGLCALAATMEEIARVGEALALTASRPEGGAGETEAATGLCFGVSEQDCCEKLIFL
jgi:MFS family permease